MQTNTAEIHRRTRQQYDELIARGRFYDAGRVELLVRPEHVIAVTDLLP